MSRQNTGSVVAGHWKTVALALLAVLAIGQSVVAGQRLVRVAPAGSPVAVGDDVSGRMVRLSGGETFELGAGNEVLLLVFDPDCAHTARLAEAWASWLADEDSGRHRTIAVSPGPLSAAVRYARVRGWNVPVGVVESLKDGVDEHPLTSRTPWVFAIGADGRVVAEGHGRRLAEMAYGIPDRWSGDHDGRGAIRRWWPASGSHRNGRLHTSELATGEYVKDSVAGSAELPLAKLIPTNGRQQKCCIRSQAGSSAG